MKDLWRRTAELFWEHPVLWLPLVCADLSAFSISSLQEAANRAIRMWLFSAHSALGGQIMLPLTPASSIKLAICTLPLVWGKYLLNACFYSAAFVVTASLVRMTLQGKNPQFLEGIQSLSSYPRRILLFTLKFLAVYLLAAIPVFIPLSYLLFFVLHRYDHGPAFGEAVALPVGIMAAWLLAPAGIRLLRPLHSESITAEVKRKGRVAAILAAIASAGVGVCALKAREAIMSSPDAFGMGEAHRQLIEASVSLLVAFPYVPLYIALALLADEPTPTALQIDSTNEDLSLIYPII